MNEDVEISEELRKYFDHQKVEFSSTRRQPNEFTCNMFRAQMSISVRAALYELTKRVESGELIMRFGRDESGRSCNLYQLAPKK
jgi:hypothetical protein